MPRYSYYYNPVSGDIKKVSIAEKKAYDEHFREERWTQLLDNETTLPTLITTFTALAGTALASWILSLVYGYLDEKGGDVSIKAKDAWSGAVYGGTLTADLLTKPFTGKGDEGIVLPGDYQPPATITYNEFWTYVQKKLVGG